jgi:hypothetical protein
VLLRGKQLLIYHRFFTDFSLIKFPVHQGAPAPKVNTVLCIEQFIVSSL